MDLKAAGKVKHISVTNMDTARLVKLQEAGVEVATNQVGGHLRGAAAGAGRGRQGLLYEHAAAPGNRWLDALASVYEEAWCFACCCARALWCW